MPKQLDAADKRHVLQDQAIGANLRSWVNHDPDGMYQEESTANFRTDWDIGSRHD